MRIDGGILRFDGGERVEVVLPASKAGGDRLILEVSPSGKLIITGSGEDVEKVTATRMPE